MSAPKMAEQGERTGPTPGPWEVGATDENGRIDIIRNDRGYRFYVAEAISGFDDGVQEANARLIAASPLLLATLTKMLRRLDNHGSIDVDNHCLRSEYDACRAAITAATGAA